MSAQAPQPPVDLPLGIDPVPRHSLKIEHLLAHKDPRLTSTKPDMIVRNSQNVSNYGFTYLKLEARSAESKKNRCHFARFDPGTGLVMRVFEIIHRNEGIMSESTVSLSVGTITAGERNQAPAHLVKQSARPEILPIFEFTTMGTDLENKIVITGQAVESRHARIEKRGEKFILKDLRTAGGTFLNGMRIIEAFLTEGDSIRIGETDFLFQADATKAELPSLLRSNNPSWQNQLARFPDFSRTQFNVLLLGESGTGKDRLARQIHDLSLRRSGPFVSVNCSALAESLIESELFGHVRGSFTGATHDRKGAFEAARGGTLFLDEVGDLPIELQPKLLRALENQEIRPVGGDREVQTDVRVIAATHQNLQRRVLDETFRADLYFRLNVVKISVPPLRERAEDFEHLLFAFAREYRVRFSVSSIDQLKQHSWPGNIRELKNLVARASALYPRQSIEPLHLSQIMDLKIEREISTDISTPRGDLPVIKEIERDMIRRRLIANRGNQRRTAHDLNMPKSTLHDRIRNYNINIDELLREAGL